ncbi:hypothetical protein C6361_11835 [Plantactinospora sp. BC1]|nr:hypothetical protein C6361_11835 [Plantactinospora sp. BC1]
MGAVRSAGPPMPPARPAVTADPPPPPARARPTNQRLSWARPVGSLANRAGPSASAGVAGARASEPGTPSGQSDNLRRTAQSPGRARRRPLARRSI